MSELQRVGVRVVGRVQGVGFRYFVLSAARRLGITGWVRNEADGSVCGEAQGDASSLDEFCAELRRGPRFARVDEARVEPLGPGPETDGFEIR